jgi:hypothetical protein
MLKTNDLYATSNPRLEKEKKKLPAEASWRADGPEGSEGCHFF